MTVKEERFLKDIAVLRKIFDFGGYVSSVALQKYLGYTLRGTNYLIQRLTQKGYLRRYEYFYPYHNEVVVHRVTAKTCKYFGKTHSYLQKQHDDCHVINALIKQHFLFSVYNEYNDIIFTNHVDNLKLFYEIGFKPFMIPTKTNGGIKRMNIEECVFYFRNSGHSDCEFIFSFQQVGLLIVYFDQYQNSKRNQLINLIKKYRAILFSKLIDCKFLIVVDREEYKIAYEKQIQKLEFNAPITCNDINVYKIDYDYSKEPI